MGAYVAGKWKITDALTNRVSVLVYKVKYKAAKKLCVTTSLLGWSTRPP